GRTAAQRERHGAGNNTIYGQGAGCLWGGAAPGGRLANPFPRHNVMRAVAPTDLLGDLVGAVILIPVASGIVQSVEARDGEVGNAGIVVDGVSVESGDSQVRPGGFLAGHGERIERRGVEEIPSYPKIVHQVRRQRVG